MPERLKTFLWAIAIAALFLLPLGMVMLMMLQPRP